MATIARTLYRGTSHCHLGQHLVLTSKAVRSCIARKLSLNATATNLYDGAASPLIRACSGKLGVRCQLAGGIKKLTWRHCSQNKRECHEATLNEPTEATVGAILCKLGVDPMKENMGNKSLHIASLVRVALVAKVPPDIIADCFAQHSVLLQVGLANFKLGVRFLKDNGFQPDTILDLLVVQPHLLTGDFELPLTAIETLRNLGYKEGSLQRLVQDCPRLLSFKAWFIKEKHSQLLKLFRKPAIRQVLLSCPSVWEESWDVTMEKIEYMNINMGVELHRIVHTKALTRSLQHIRTRHLFLEKAGVYKKPPKRGAMQIVNPSLKRIVDSSDEEFATYVAGLTLAEYEVFAQLVELELDGIFVTMNRLGVIDRERPSWSDTDDSDSEYADDEGLSSKSFNDHPSL